MLIFSLITFALGQNIAEIDYSVQVGAVPKAPAAIVATLPALPSAQAYANAPTTQTFVSGGGGFTRSAGIMFGYARTIMNGPWPERAALAMHYRDARPGGNP